MSVQTSVIEYQAPARLTTARHIYDSLRGAITDNSLPPETRLSEAETAQRYGVSRQPVREAFIALARQGLVDVRAQRGTFVSKISLDAVMDARFVREAIEADIVKLLAAAPDAALVADLKRQLVLQAAVVGRSVGDFIAADETFHRTLADGAGKANAWRVVMEMKAQMDRVRYLSSLQFSLDRLIDQHRAVVAAVEAGDRAGAEEAMRTHLQGILAELPAVKRERPDYFV